MRDDLWIFVALFSPSSGLYPPVGFTSTNDVISLTGMFYLPVIFAYFYPVRFQKSIRSNIMYRVGK